MLEVFDALPAHVAVMDREGTILAVNQAWRAFAQTDGVSRMHAVRVGANYFDACRSEAARCPDARVVLSGLEQVVAGRSASFEWEYPCTSRDQSLWFLLQAAPLQGADRGLVVTVVNITRRRQAEQALARRLRSLASQLTFSEARERQRIAAGLHDHLQQLLVACKLKLQHTRKEKPDPAVIEQVASHLDEAVAYTRSLTRELSPPVLEKAGLSAAVAWLIQQTRERFDLDVRCEDDGRAKPLREVKRVLIYEAVRELLLNMAKHADARHGCVRLSREDDHIRVTVEDDGRGFDTATLGEPAGPQRGFGLFSIGERLRYFDGDLSIDSAPSRGTRIQLHVPLDADEG